jgi:hypothetical protein
MENIPWYASYTLTRWMVVIHLSPSLGINFCLMVSQKFQSNYCFHPWLGVNEIVGSNNSSSPLIWNSNILSTIVKRLWHLMLHKKKVKIIWTYFQKLITTWMKILRTFKISYSQFKQKPIPSTTYRNLIQLGGIFAIQRHHNNSSIEN